MGALAKTERNEALLARYNEGVSLSLVAAEFGISRQAAWVIIDRAARQGRAVRKRIPCGTPRGFTQADREKSVAVCRAKAAARTDIAAAVALVEAGYSFGRAADLTGLSRNAVAGAVYRARRAA